MPLLTVPRSRQSRRVFQALLALILLAPGCGVRTHTPSLPLSAAVVGRWRGAVRSGPVSVPSEWTLGPDGSQSITLTFPQGALTASGTFTVQGGQLTARTTSRSFALGDSVRAQPLTDANETTYAAAVSGDTLTLTRPDTQETIILTREQPPAKGDHAP